ncbi:MAG: hypothetical protein RNU03_05040 [Candidatus Sedimenticola sp. (ex Thyasira tokunagai)]
MNRFISKKIFAVLLLLSVASSAVSDDIDIFMNPGATSSALPNILFIIDNTANWSRNVDGERIFTPEIAALKQVVEGLDEDTVNIGLMFFAEGGDALSNTKGAYVRKHITTMDAAGKASLVTLIDSFDRNDDKGDSARWATAMNEAYLYYTGSSPYSGTKEKADAAAFVGGNKYGTYLNPITGQVCAKNYIIFISNGGPDNGENNTASALLEGLNGKQDSDPIDLTPSGRQTIWADEYARFIQADQNIITYTIDVQPVSTGQGDDNSALLDSIATQGGGRCFAVGADGCAPSSGTDTLTALVSILDTIIDEIQATNSVFAASALPVSVNVRGTNENQVYMGVFRPDANALPRWFGNLKLFQLGYDTQLYLADKNGLKVQSPTTGFLVDDAISFWTHTSDYWSYHPEYTESDSPDGPVVEKGGAAQRLRDTYDETATPPRTVYTFTSTCTEPCTATLDEFGTANTAITTADLGAADSTERDAIIDWVIGEDNTTSAERAAGEVRPSIDGDVIHSTPAVINYSAITGTTVTSERVVAFYGSNNGVFRAVEGGTADTKGTELWGFVAEEFFSGLKRIRDNNTAINVPSIPNDSNNKPYFFDGSIGVHSLDANGDGDYVDTADGDKVHIFITVRRGGRFIYALDVSNPDSPKFMWKKDYGDTGYGELGQTWSKPTVVPIDLAETDGGDSVSTYVLVFGGGYDPVADDDWPAGTASQGRGIFVVRADNGNVLWQAGPAPTGATHNVTVADMTYSIPSDISVLTSAGTAVRAYVGDTGGNVWRLNMSDEYPGNWVIEKMAALAGINDGDPDNNTPAGMHARKFLFPPDVVYGDGFDAILIGSGDREHPLDANEIYDIQSWADSTLGVEIVDRFYMLKDVTGQTLAESDLVDVSDMTQSVATNSPGWYITLSEGEKVVSGTVTTANSTFFNTSQPPATTIDPDTCEGTLGTAKYYMVNYVNGDPIEDMDSSGGALEPVDRSGTLTGGGLPPSPVPVLVEIDGEKRLGIVTGTSLLNPGTVNFSQRFRTYWFKDAID